MQVEQTQTPMISNFDYMVRGWKTKTVYIKLSNGVVLERTKHISPVGEDARLEQKDKNVIKGYAREFKRLTEK